jgi:hypothetical protein
MEFKKLILKERVTFSRKLKQGVNDDKKLTRKKEHENDDKKIKPFLPTLMTSYPAATWYI